MNPDVLVPVVISVLMAIGSFTTTIVAAYKSLKMSRREFASSEADAIEKYQKIAQIAADRALKLDERITRLEDERDELKKVIREQRDMIEKQGREIALLSAWASRLVHQVKSLGVEPVAFNVGGATDARPDAGIVD